MGDKVPNQSLSRNETDFLGSFLFLKDFEAAAKMTDLNSLSKRSPGISAAIKLIPIVSVLPNLLVAKYRAKSRFDLSSDLK